MKTTKQPIPQWLKEVISRGFKPEKIYKDFDKSLFGFVDTNSDKLVKFPLKKIFVLEGIPGSGKTTILNKIDNQKIITIDQILPRQPNFDQSMSQKFYFRSERLKTIKCLGSNKSNCLLDRYYVSTLAFYWSYDKIFKTNKYKKAISWYEKSIKNSDIIKPFMVFYINTPLNLSFKRKNRVPSDNRKDLWFNKDFLFYFEEYYRYFFSSIENKTRVVHLSGNKSISQLIGNIEDYIYEEKF